VKVASITAPPRSIHRAQAASISTARVWRILGEHTGQLQTDPQSWTLAK
jgi:hypothetical protein